jgi:hypothetical protein
LFTVPDTDKTADAGAEPAGFDAFGLGVAFVLAGVSFVVSMKSIDWFTPDYMKNCDGFGHAGMCFLGAAPTALVTFLVNVFQFTRRKKENDSSVAVMHQVLAAILICALGTGLTLLFNWLSHHSGGHVCHPWSP